MKISWFTIFAIMVVLYFPSAANAHNKVVVIPLMDDLPPRVYAPVKTDEAPRADYFIHSETARDLVTGLEWQRNEYEFSLDWPGADDFCRALVLRGFGDWRLPSIKELIGITDYTRLSPALSVQAFPNPKTSLNYWSSTVYPGQFDPITRALTLDISTGAVPIYSALTSQQYVRCVRAGNSNGSTLIDNGDGTVQDLSFGLMWEKTTFSQPFDSLSLAREYCLSLVLGGFSDWRVPSIKELVSLLDFRIRPMMIRVFPYFPSGFSREFLYSGTLYPGGTPPDGVWVVRFNNEGYIYDLVGLTPLEDNISSGVKCVRNVN